LPPEGPRLEPWLDRWSLEPDGPAFTTPFGSRLAPVISRGGAAMLKVAGGPEERDGAALMAWWAGDGAAEVLAHDGEALLLVRSTDPATLAALARGGRDDEATTILCAVASRLHAPRPAPPPSTLRPLASWFRALEPAARAHGGLLESAADAARELLATPREVSVLHGDLHHDNVLAFGDRGWLAIDPKGLIGERGYDFANLFCNPWPEADDADRLARRLAIVARSAGLDPARQRQWILAYAGLSAAWTIDSGLPADGPWRALRIAELVLSGM
jgi:streptomycin 6-kinase